MSVAGGIRSDFGYVGDVGAFPPDLDALVANPGGYSTWNGPYLPPEFLGDSEGFKTDEWGEDYIYSGGFDITSNGSGSTMRKGGNPNPDDYLLNTINGIVLDRADSVPGTAWMDSVEVEIIVPDGLGDLETKTYYPDSSGEFTMDSIPVGKHFTRAIYTPEVDTLVRYAHVLPRHVEDEMVRFNFAENYFSEETDDSMLTLVAGSQSVYGNGSDCNNIQFEIRNNTGEDIELSSIELTWDSPLAYYQEVSWGADKIWEDANPRNGSTETATFDSPQTITYGSTALIKVEVFSGSATGSGGSKPDMSNTTFTVTFSEGSTFDVTMEDCE